MSSLTSKLMPSLDGKKTKIILVFSPKLPYNSAMKTINTMTASEKLMRHFATRLTELNAHYDGNVTLEELVDSFIIMDKNVSLIQDPWFEAWSMSN